MKYDSKESTNIKGTPLQATTDQQTEPSRQSDIRHSKHTHQRLYIHLQHRDRMKPGEEPEQKDDTTYCTKKTGFSAHPWSKMKAQTSVSAAVAAPVVGRL